MREDNSTLTELGRRLVSESLSDVTLQQATERTPDFAILPWVNVVKIGGQSIMDRGRSAVGPLVEEIVANLEHHKMILGTGAGTRARHIYSLAIDLGLPTGVLTVLGTAEDPAFPSAGGVEGQPVGFELRHAGRLRKRGGQRWMSPRRSGRPALPRR